MVLGMLLRNGRELLRKNVNVRVNGAI